MPISEKRLQRRRYIGNVEEEAEPSFPKRKTLKQETSGKNWPLDSPLDGKLDKHAPRKATTYDPHVLAIS